MSFNMDDPLAGILSDGSDDSFFDDDILGKKKPQKKKSTTADKKSSLFDLGDSEKPKPVSSVSDAKKESLFDLSGDTKKEPVSNDFRSSMPAMSPAKRTLSKDSFKTPQTESKQKIDVIKSPAKPKIHASADKIDILSDLMPDKKESNTKVLEKGKSSQSILDDILGGSSTKPTGSGVTKSSSTTKSQNFDLDSFLGKTESKTNTKITSQKQATSDVPKEEKKPKEDGGKKKPGADWLGIFQDNEETVEEDDADMPSWLVGGDSKKKKNETKKQTKQEAKVEKPVNVEPEKEHEPKEVSVPQVVEQVAPTVVSASKLQVSNEDLTTESASLYLQQQESQLMVAMQLKAQEERLVAMQMRQKESQRVQREAALAHHSQLDAMLQKQAEQRTQMQAIINTHQQRISERIKALLGTTPENDDNVTPNEDFGTLAVENNTPYIREKKQLLQLVQSLQENHDKEIDLMETSYRRQLVFLEVTQNQAEERMKEESEKLVKFYTEKINWLEEHHQLYKNMTEDNISSLTERHKAENVVIRQQYLENVKVLQEHHAALMENIKNAVKHEQALINDSAVFSNELHELVTDVRDNKSHCQQLVEKVEKIVENTQRDSERSLQARENNIEDMMQQLKKEREQLEVEKSESRDIVKMLEARLKQMTTMIEEESASLKQKRMEFDFEKATFSKQTEFAKNILKKQDEEIKALREDVQKEYNEKTTKIEEDRTKVLKDSAAIAKEKSTIQNLKQELEKMKAELQAQLEEVTEERSKLNVEKQELHLEEQRILSKSRDYDLLAKTTIDKQSQADKKYAEAEFLQRKYEERIRRIQEHVVSLNSREKQIAREKVALSRERLHLHNERKQIESRQQCSLCKSSQNTPVYIPPYALPESYMNVSVSRDYRANVDTSMNNIERDIASLVNRNYSVRNTEDIAGGGHDVRYPTGDTAPVEMDSFKDFMDPKFLMLRLDVQKVLSNLDHSKKENEEKTEDIFDRRLDE